MGRMYPTEKMMVATLVSQRRTSIWRRVLQVRREVWR